MSVIYRETKDIPIEKLLPLYEAVDWPNYTRHPQQMADALAHSDWACSAWLGDELIGLVRAHSDGYFIAWVQDILVHPRHQRRGIGRELLSRCLRRYEHVGAVALFTDDEPRQQAFYEALGLRRMEAVSERLRCFVRVGKDTPP